jgi:hypothetical protein
LPAPQGLSQAPTSFIGSRCQGIHHAPLTTCHTPRFTAEPRPGGCHTPRETPQTIKQPTITRTNTPTQHGPPEGVTRQTVRVLEQTSQKTRCSRPLCSSQPPHPPTPRRPVKERPASERHSPPPRRASTGSRGVLPQDPTVRHPQPPPTAKTTGRGDDDST